MGCLYCGKDIGPLRRLRDSEFCGPVHRQRYGERLGRKALDRLASTDLVPSAIPGAHELWPLQEGEWNQSEGVWDFGQPDHPIQLSESCPLAITPHLGTRAKALPHPRPASGTPVHIWSKSPPESSGITLCLPAFEKPSWGGLPTGQAAVTCDPQAGVAAPRESRLKAEIIPLPVRSSASAKLVSVDRACHPTPALLVNWMPAPAPEAVVCQVSPSASTELYHEFRLTIPNVSEFVPAMPRVDLAASQRMPAAEPAATEVGPLLSLALAVTSCVKSAGPVLPDLAQFQLIDDVHSDPIAAQPSFGVPHSSSPALVGPQPIPVQSWFARAPVPMPVEAVQAPALRLTAFDPGYAVGIPLADRDSKHARSSFLMLPRPVEAELAYADPRGPVLAEVDAAALRLPQITFKLDEQHERPACLALPEPAQLLSSFTPIPLPIPQRALAMALPMPVRPGSRSTLHLARIAPGRAPNPAESLPGLAAFAAFRISSPPATQLPQVPQSITAGLSAAGSGRSYPRSAAPEPPEHVPNGAILELISSMRVNGLDLPADSPVSTVPRPGFIPIEFYCQRSQVTPHRRLSWAAPELTPVWPRFGLRIAVDRIEDPAPWKPASKTASDREIPVLGKRRVGNRTVEQFLKIAACLVMGVFLWFGARELKNGGLSAANGRASATPDAANSSSTLAVAPPSETGTLARVRQAIANRAAYAVTDTLQSDMQAWGVPAKSWAPGWSRNPDGYAHTGELALFHPSLKYKDYRLEFFGQIENKSLGWVVRAQDVQNYYAMKFTVLKPGLRPTIAMAHYPVIAGRKGRKVESPLSVMVHRNTPIHVAVDVQGNRVTASIEGQQVDSWTDDLLPTGGVGFFSEAGEKARLYWMKVSKNQDWLGSICSYLSSPESTHDTAELWTPGIPANIPTPTVPEQPVEVALAEADSGVNDFSTLREARILV